MAAERLEKENFPGGNTMVLEWLVLNLTGDEGWVGKHPWRPFDRDKDLEVQMQRPKGAADLLKAAGAPSSRFSGGNR